MMSVEVRRSGGVVGGGADPSNLHLKKELVQIRKAARGVLKDPGTSSSWRSPLGSEKSRTKNHFMHYLHKNEQIEFDGNAIASSSEQFLHFPLQVDTYDRYINGNVASDNANSKEKNVFLYNWRDKKSETEDDVENGKNDGSSFTQEESPNYVDSSTSVSNGGGNDSKSDSCLSNSVCKCKDTNCTPSIRRSIRKKSKRSSYSSSSSRHHKEKLKMLLSRYTENAVDSSAGSSLGRDDLLSLVDQCDDTDDYCNSEDLERASAISPLLARFKNYKAHLPIKSPRSVKSEDGSVSYSMSALSTSFYNRYSTRNPSTVESWDATTVSFNDADDEVDDHLDFPGQQGCGIPCYWSRRSTPKSRNGSCCSPSLSDTLRRKGSSMLCGSQTVYQKRLQRRLGSKIAGQSLVPLLKHSGDGRGSSMESGISDDEVTTNFGELDLEALSRLDGKRWSSSVRSQEGLEIVAFNGEVNAGSSPESMRSLSYKHRPMFFEELIGQNIVVKALMSGVSRERIAPLYLFDGPHGVGKTSTARIFACALYCLATEETKPCGVCRECADFISGKSRYLVEVDGSNKKGIEKVKNILKKLSVVNPSSALSQYKVFVVDECHLWPSKTWLTFLRFLEKPLLPRVVFILITADIDNVPRAILSRCQKYFFNKISDGDIVTRLRKISSDESLDVESNALELIASNADGSLRDAEITLDQLRLFGKRITKSLVNELIGVVSDDKLLELLELAMSSNATETVIRARELMDSGVDPIVLTSQLVTLIVDIIAENYPIVDAEDNDYFCSGRSLSERELDRLKHALRVLSEAEKHLRLSSERSTWFTATLLQLGSMPSPGRKTQPTSSRRQSSHDFIISMPREAKQRSDVQFATEKAAVHSNSTSLLIDIWLKCIEKCHSKTLRQLLDSYGKLVSISEMKGGFVAHIAFEDGNIKTRAEGFFSSITNSFEIVLRCNVEVKLILLRDSPGPKLMIENPMNLENKSTRWNTTVGNSDLDLRQDSLKLSRGSFKVSEDHQTQPLEESITTNASISTPKDSSKSGIPLRRIQSIIHEQRLETAWLQVMVKNTPGSTSLSKLERNQVFPQDGIDCPNELESVNSMDVPLHHREDELNHEIKALKINDGMANEKDQIVKRTYCCPISMSFVSNASKDNMGYGSESGAGGCGGVFCWNNNSRPHRKGKAKQGNATRARKSGRFSWLESAKSRQTDNIYRR